MKFTACVRDGFSFLAEPGKSFKRLQRRSLEQVLGQYMKLLLASGALAGVTSTLFLVGKALYYHLFGNVTIEYLRLLNYGASIAAGTFFFYLFGGTVLFGVVSLLLNLFVRTKYTTLVKVLCLALLPVLLLGWFAQEIAIGLLVWSIYLLILGLSQAK